VNGIGLLIAATSVGAAGILLVASGLLQPAPTLARTLQHIQRASTPSAGAGGAVGSAFGRRLAASIRIDSRLLPSDAQLLLADRSVEQQTLWLAASALGGLVGPYALLGLMQASGLVGLSWFVPLGAGLAGAALGPLTVHLTTVERASVVRTDMRYQVSAYLDVVTMLLAGNSGYEGALEQAAHAGDGRLFVELRRQMRESGARGASLTEALQHAGQELGLEELEQIAATAALSAAEGAPVARTLAAKCSTLRAALASEQEAEARLRTSRLTTPIVGMALIFMALVIYPALSFS
jgi:Flp pilus assembly protein TadB